MRRLLVALVVLLFIANVSASAQAEQTGKTIFAANCATCHQAQGEGIADGVPPVAKNAYVSGDPKAVIRTLLYGKKGAIVVNGKKYDGRMPAWKDLLKPAEIAAVATFIRTSLGNKGSAVTEKQVLALKK